MINNKNNNQQKDQKDQKNKKDQIETDCNSSDITDISDNSNSKKHSNLIPFSKRSKSEARKFGKIGGIQSGKVRRERRSIKEQLEIALEITTNHLIANSENEEEKQLLKKAGVDGFVLMQILNSKESSPDTKLSALDKLWNRVHGRPRQEITVEEKLEPPVIHFMGVMPQPFVPKK